MHIGRFPGLEKALAKRLEEKKPTASRRNFLTTLFVAIGGAACGLGGYAIGRTKFEETRDGVGVEHPPSNSRTPWKEQVVWARRLAKGPRQDLLQHYSSFCTVAERSKPDTTIWLGLERLGHATLNADTDASVVVADRLLQAFSLWPCPSHLVTLRSKLQAKSR